MTSLTVRTHTQRSYVRTHRHHRRLRHHDDHAESSGEVERASSDTCGAIWRKHSKHAGSDRSVHVVVITGAGRAFCAGGDVASMAELIERHDAEEFSRLLGAARRVITRDSADDETGDRVDQWSSFGRGLQSRARLRSAHRFEQRHVSANRLRKSGCIRIGAALISCRVWSRQTKRAKCFFWATRSMPRKRCGWES